MCGICGEIRLDRNPASSRTVEAMAEVLAPRGPDSAGAFAQGRVAFGHRRLKIIDLSDAAQQPMVDPALGPDHRVQRLHLQLPANCAPNWKGRATSSSPTATPR